MTIKEKLRSEVDQQYTWNLNSLFSDDNEWQKKYDECIKKSDEFNIYKKNLSSSSTTLLNVLKLKDQVSLLSENLYVYANLKHHEDTTNTFYQGMSDKSDGMLVIVSSAMSFIESEILSIETATLNNFFKENSELKLYTHYLDDLTRLKAHILNPELEELLANTAELGNAPENIYSTINNADITFGTVKNEDGEDIVLTHAKFTSLLESKDVKVRENTFKTFYASYEKQKNTFACIYNASVKKDAFYAKARNFDSSLDSALASYNINKEVYTNLIETVHKFLPALHKYVKLRKKRLGLKEIHMYDLYTPIVLEANTFISYEDAKIKVLEALAPLGDDYISKVSEGFNNRWIDVYENKGKRNGAYSFGSYDSLPYILLNFDNKINDMFTLAHEMGHSMHSYYTRTNQNYIYGDYTIFLAEVASTVNESLLMQYLLKTTTDKHFKEYLLNYFMEQFRGTLFRQTMFAEFEMITHEMVEKGEPLTVDSLSSIYKDLVLKYYGDEIILDEEIAIEWARIPHFYSAFYVYQYATGYSAAIALSQTILDEGEPAVAKYKDFLKSGSSDYSLNILKKAGVDMSTSEPIAKALSVFEDILDTMENL